MKIDVPQNTTALDLALSLSGSLTGYPAVLAQLPVDERVGFDHDLENVEDIGQTWTPDLAGLTLDLNVPVYNAKAVEKAPFTTDLHELQNVIDKGNVWYELWSKNMFDYVNYDVDAIRLLMRMEEQPSVDVADLINETIINLKQFDLWDKIKHLYCYRVHTLQAALLDWKGGSDATAYGNVGFRAGYGVKGDGVSAYISNGFLPEQTLTNNSLGVLCEVVNATSIVNSYLFGSFEANTFLSAQYHTNRYNFILGGTNAIYYNAANVLNELFYSQRDSSSALNLRLVNGGGYTGGTVLNTAASLPNVPMVLLALNSSGNITNFSNAEIGWFGFMDAFGFQQDLWLHYLLKKYNQKIITLL